MLYPDGSLAYRKWASYAFGKGKKTDGSFSKPSSVFSRVCTADRLKTSGVQFYTDRYIEHSTLSFDASLKFCS